MQVPHIHLNDRYAIPQLGFGTWKIENKDAAEKVAYAIKTGYRHIDTARIYENEKGVGQGIKQSGVARDKIFLTTKLWNADQGYDSALRACEESLKRLGVDYLNLYLIHWPCPPKGLFVDSWKALIRLHEQGLVKSIGVSNFRIEDLERIMSETGVKPVINQIELHPYYQENALRAFHQKHHIATEAYSPLRRGDVLKDPVLIKIAEKHGKSVGQIVLRWHIELGNIVIPKSNTENRIAENFHIFDFSLDDEDKAQIAKLDKKDGRRGHDIATYIG